MVAIIDYGMGNTGSVKNAMTFLGEESIITNRADEIDRASHIILPGVGAFGDAMQKLEELGLPELLHREVFEKGKIFLGICLGMQLLADVGEEGGERRGLGWIPGRVSRLKVDEDAYRLPHVGWNDVTPTTDATLFRNVEPSIFYFVHSFVLRPTDPSAVSATCTYGETFAASVQQGNIFGTQFHPEKSQKSGLALLRNFLAVT